MLKSARKRPGSPLFRAGAFTLSAAVVLAGCSNNQPPVPTPNLTTSNTAASASAAPSAAAPGSIAATGSSAAPAKSIADPALLAAYSTSGIAMTDSVTPDPTKNFVTTPAGTVTVTQVGRVSDVSVASGNAITGTPDPSKTYIPAAGHHFIVFTVAVKPGWPTFDATAAEAAGTTMPAGTVSLNNGGTTTDITAQVGFVTTQPGANPSTVTGPTTFVASVADGASASLVVGAAGHNQTLTVDTASRVADPVAAVYYQTNRQVAVNATSPITTKTWQYKSSNGGVDPVTVTYALTASTVTFTAYSPEKGWAPEGQMWVQVAVADNTDLNGSTIKEDYSAWSLTDTTKKLYKTVTNTLAGQQTGTATFLVPITTTNLTASLGTKLTVTSGYDTESQHPYTLQASPAVFTAVLH